MRCEAQVHSLPVTFDGCWRNTPRPVWCLFDPNVRLLVNPQQGFSQEVPLHSYEPISSLGRLFTALAGNRQT
jgi:hypothetical protein